MTTDNPSAFPVTPEVWATHPDFHGMTLRDYFAGQALASMYANANAAGVSCFRVASDAYKQADAMLSAREGAA